MSWKQVRGHDGLVKAFDHIVRRGRLAHAYFFAGPPGVGKRRFAGELAKALLCENPPRDRVEACDHCSACQLVEAGTHPDLTTAGRPEEVLELPIETIRELCRALALKPARGRYKVAILDDADDLNEAAANCFLKTLEEPPPHSLLLLIGTSPELQLPTIVSRCQVVRFHPLSEDLVAELLRQQGVEDPALVRRLARLSGGSLGQAQALADPELWEFRRKFFPKLVRADAESVGLAEEWMRFLEEAGKESAAHRRRAQVVVRLLVDFLHDVLRLRVGGTPRLAEPDDLGLLQELGNRADPEQLIDVVERCLEGDRHLDRRVQLVLAVEALADALGKKLRGRKPA